MNHAKTKNRLLIALELLFAFVLLCFGFSLGKITSNNADAVSVKAELQEDYYLGELLLIPEDVKLVVGDNEVPATAALVYYPSGKAYCQDAYALSELGKYEIIFSATYDNQRITASSFFNVIEDEETRDVDAPIVKASLTTDFKNPVTSVTVAMNEPIAISQNVEVSDENYFGGLKTSVYYDKGNANESAVLVKNGQFTPTLEGEYTVVYTATDAYGNKGVAEIVYTAVNGQALTYTQPNKLTSITSGAEYTLEEIEDAKSVSGEVDVCVSVISPAGEAMDMADSFSFTPDMLGEYTVQYELSTLVYKKVFTYQVTCVNQEGMAFFYNDFILPRYFIRNALYQLDTYTAYEPIEKGFKEVETEIWASEDGGAYEKIANVGQFKTDALETVSFRYVVGERFIESQAVPVIEVGYGTEEIEYLDYFVGNYTAKETTYDDFSFTFESDDYSANPEFTLDFINPVSFDNFVLEFTIPEGYANFTEMHIVLTDYTDATRINTIKYAQTTQGFTFDVVEESTKYNTVTTAKIPGIKHILQCDSGTKIVNNQACVQPCVPIESDKCYITIKFVGATGACRLNISKINTQMLNNSIWESNPEMANKYYGVRYTGDTLEILPMEFANVFNPTLAANAMVTMCLPDGSNAKTTDGETVFALKADQKYSVKLETSGMWTIQYVVTSATSNQGEVIASTQYSVNVLDVVPPTVTFSNGITAASVIEVPKNTLYQLPGYTVTDNNTAAADIKVLMYVLDEKNHLYTWDKTEISFQDSGRYTIIVYAVDADGNLTKASYTILVR